MFLKLQQEKKLTLIVLAIISGIVAFTLLNIVFPLAIYLTVTKLAILVIGYCCTFVIIYFIYDRFIRGIWGDIKEHRGRNIALAFLLTAILLSLSKIHLPYHPVTHQIQIETSASGLGISGISRRIEDGPYQVLDHADLRFDGSWQTFGQQIIHTDNQPGAISYQRNEMVRSSLQYEFRFAPANEPVVVVVVIDGIEHVLNIPSVADEGETSFLLPAAELSSTSSIWQVVIAIFPFTVVFTMFSFVFAGISWIFAKKQTAFITLLQILLFSIIFYLLWITINFQNSVLNPWTFRWGYSIVVLFVFLLIPISLHKWVNWTTRNTIILLIMVLLLGVGLRVYWIAMVPSSQVSDFGRFHQWALQIINHEADIYIDRYANFTRALSLLYRIYPDPIIVEAINILFSMGTALCLYMIGKNTGQEKIGLLAAYWFVVFPPQIAMTSIVNTDIPAIFFLVLSVLFTSIAIRKKENWFFFAAGTAFAFCIFIRGAMLIYLPALFFVILLLRKKDFSLSLKSSGILLLSLLVMSIFLNQIIQFVDTDDMVVDESRYLVWPLINGVNVEFLGRNNVEDSALMRSWTGEGINQMGISLVFNRIFSNPLGLYSILKEKFEYQFANATYPVDLAFYTEKGEYFYFETGWPAEVTEIREGFAQVAQYSYIMLLILTLWAALKINGGELSKWLPTVAILSCAFAAYTLFEVQPRYNKPIIPFILLLAALAFHREQNKPQSLPDL